MPHKLGDWTGAGFAIWDFVEAIQHIVTGIGLAKVKVSI